MIIDLILDRKDGQPYEAQKFYSDVLKLSQNGTTGDEIIEAIESGNEREVKKALVMYLLENEYNDSICGYVINQNWL